MNNTERPPINTVEFHTQEFWEVQQQWQGRADHGITVSQASTMLRKIINNYRMPKSLRAQAYTLQQEIIMGSTKARKKSNTKQY